MKQPWVHSPLVDGIFILGSPFLIVAAALLLPASFGEPDSMTVVSWALLVMGVDVSHVYSTLYRTYLDPETHRDHRLFLYLLPFVVFVACMALYSFGALVFWRVMAYLAVFHFARQQFGFMRVYARSETQGPWQRRLDALAIYTATFYPIADWHLSGPKNFNWFMKGDFWYLGCGDLSVRPASGLCLQSTVEPLRNVLFFFYIGILLIYAGKEAFRCWKSASWNIPKNGILAGTVLSWYVGIVHFNSDLAFTAINVVAHGVPYIALVWIYGRKKYKAGTHYESRWAWVFRPRYVAFFVASLLILAYFEEGLWNIWVWHDKEHAGLFTAFHTTLGELNAGSPWLRIIVPLLSVPQITHYVIDGFIWKVRKDKYAWRDITLPATALPKTAAETV